MAKRSVDPEIGERPFAHSGLAGKPSAIAAGHIVAGHIVTSHEIVGLLLAAYVYL